MKEMVDMKYIQRIAYSLCCSLVGFGGIVRGKTRAELEASYRKVSSTLHEAAKFDTNIQHSAREALDQLDSFFMLAKRLHSERKDLKRRVQKHQMELTQVQRELQQAKAEYQGLQERYAGAAKKLDQQKALVTMLTNAQDKLKQEVTPLKGAVPSDQEQKKREDEQLAQVIDGSLNLTSISAPISP